MVEAVELDGGWLSRHTPICEWGPISTHGYFFRRPLSPHGQRHHVAEVHPDNEEALAGASKQDDGCAPG